MSESNNGNPPDIVVPDKFYKVMKDFTTDILTTFPEYKENLDQGLCDILTDTKDSEDVKKLFNFVKNVYPERFFDLLYQNEDIFTNKEINTEFLPNIDFSVLWHQDISDNTKLVIWKYLQLVLFSAINTESDDKSFKDTAKLFEAINEDELKNKLEETMEQMSKIFEEASKEGVEENKSTGTGEDRKEGEGFFSTDPSGAFNAENLPNPDDIHEHINDMLKGNLGKLATEITEETMKELNDDVSEASTVNDVFQTLFKNPGKLMSMIKKVGNKLDTKLKSGELKESELMEEAMELMEKMDSMPGMKNMKNMLNKMGIPGMGGMGSGKNAKMNMSAMAGQLKQNVKMSKQKERMLKKLEARKNAKNLDQIEILQQKLNAAKLANQQLDATYQQNIDELVSNIESPSLVPEKKKKKKRKKKNKNKNRKKGHSENIKISTSDS